MDGFFEKFGLYDLFSMLVAGVISESIAILIVSKCFYFDITGIFKLTLMFLFVGYLIGLILHEIVGATSKQLKNTFSRSVLRKQDYFFKCDCDKEMLDRVKVHILGNEKTITEDDETYITSVCVNELQIKNAITAPDRFITQSEMALSICIATAIMFITTLVAGIICLCVYKINVALTIATLISLPIISLIFYHRSKRMHRYYIRCLIRTYAVSNDLARIQEE